MISKSWSPIIIKDKIYETTEVTSPVILELLNSKSLRRLKRIAQYGVPDEFYHLKNYSRFEHSLGVMLLLKKLGASEEEQIAGLLHDISHTAFSHVIDWVLGSGKRENYQDKKHENYPQNNAEITGILKRYNYQTERIFNHHNFRLLERKLPALCADRTDYALREFAPQKAKHCANALTVRKGKIVFKDRNSASLFARNFLKRQREHWGGFEAASRYRIFADVLKRALDKKIISLDSFRQDDSFILKKLKKTNDKKIQKTLAVLKEKSLTNLPKSKRIVHKKFRYAIPDFIFNNKLIRLTKVDTAFKKEVEVARWENRQGVSVPSIT